MGQSTELHNQKELHPHLSENEKALLPYFQDSLKSTSLRTLTYVHESADHAVTQVWREAHKVPENGWFVFEKKRSLITLDVETDESISQPSIAQKLISEDLSFFDVIEELSVFETSQSTMGYKPLDKDEINELGKKYYKNLAEAEGIVFNVQGMPHPTLNGNVIAENQSFFEEAYKKAASSPKRKKTKSFKRTLPSLFGEAAPTIDIKKGTSFSNEIDTLSLLKRAVKRIREYTEKANNTGWLRDVGDYSNSYASFSKFFKGYSNNQLRPVFSKLSADQFEGVENKEAFVKNINCAINLTLFYANACKAAGSYKSYQENGPKVSYFHYRKGKSRAIKHLKVTEIYNPSEVNGIMESFMNDPTDMYKETFSKLGHIIEWAGTLKKEFEAAKANSAPSLRIDELPLLETSIITKAQLPAPK